METFRTIWQGLNWSYLTDMVISVIPALICITFHELCHGFAAYMLGDPTAKRAGRLTMNPIKHIDWMGLAMMVVFHFGWAKPVPVNPNYFKDPKKHMAVTALAGPLSNFVLAAVLMLLYGPFYVLTLVGTGGVAVEIAAELMVTTAYLSLALAVFNLLPIPPLDGSKVLFALLPERQYWQLMRYERYGMILMIILVSTGILGTPLSRVTGSLFELMLYNLTQLTADWTATFLWR